MAAGSFPDVKWRNSRLNGRVFFLIQNVPECGENLKHNVGSNFYPIINSLRLI